MPLIFWDPNSVFSKRSSCKVLYCLVSSLQFFIPMFQRAKEDGAELFSRGRLCTAIQQKETSTIPQLLVLALEAIYLH